MDIFVFVTLFWSLGAPLVCGSSILSRKVVRRITPLLCRFPPAVTLGASGAALIIDQSSVAVNCFEPIDIKVDHQKQASSRCSADLVDCVDQHKEVQG